MNLTISIGNTNIRWAIFEKNELIRASFFSTEAVDYSKFLNSIFKENKIEKVILCSVVPQATQKIKRALDFFKKEILILGENVKVPLKNLYRKKKRLGQDRLLNAFTAVLYYGTPVVVVDLGTAITFDVVSKNKEFLGGFILPGLGISLKALQENTALLPKLKLKFPSEFIGKDTQQCILSGIIFGFSELIDGLIRRLRKKMGRNLRVVLTGGDACWICNYLKEKFILDKDLALKGLNFLVDKKD
ncbi:MAG: type III pantothenate kinase [Candidatus Omnitrophica bacterium]|nr:type III pantothenate kinase [Candidatus Omnitrophota bacterium]